MTTWLHEEPSSFLLFNTTLMPFHLNFRTFQICFTALSLIADPKDRDGYYENKEQIFIVHIYMKSVA